MPLYVATATHVAARGSDQPTAARILAAFQRVFSPEKGWIMLGGAPRITRQIHSDNRSAAASARGIGMLTIGLGYLAAPFTMGMSLAPAAFSAATGSAAAGALRSFYTTTATAVIETQASPADVLAKIAREFGAVLGPGWSAVSVGAYAPATNGPEGDWRSGAIQRASLSTDPQGLLALVTAVRDNPIGPTPPNPPRGGGVITSLVDDVTAAGAAAVDNVTRGLRSGVVNVTGAAGDGLRNVGGALGGVATGFLTTVFWVVGGVVAVGAGAAYLIGKSTGRGTAATAGGALSGALALTPVGRVLGNPAVPAPLPGMPWVKGDPIRYVGKDAVRLAVGAGMRLTPGQFVALDRLARLGTPVDIYTTDGAAFMLKLGSASGRRVPPRVAALLTRVGLEHKPYDGPPKPGWGWRTRDHYAATFRSDVGIERARAQGNPRARGGVGALVGLR